MKSITIKGQLRSETGKKSSRQLRSEGQVPGVIYGGNETIHFSATPLELRPIIYTGEFMLANIEIEGKGTFKAILKDLQIHKLSEKLTHVDFLELVEDKKVIANIPLNFTGTSIGVKNGGRFVPKMTTIKVRTVPANLRENIDVDITNLKIGGNVRISDVAYENAEIMHSPRIPVASVVTTRVLKQAANAGEIIGGDEEGEEGAEEGAEAPAEA
jgi:large subunit ribosomal protein L25